MGENMINVHTRVSHNVVDAMERDKRRDGERKEGD